MNVSLNKILKQSNVLYLSSNDKLCKQTINILKLFFKKIIFRDNVEKAILAFDNIFIHLIITEIDLYESNGIEFIKKIRSINNKIPIIVITENKSIDVLLEVVKLNLTDYIIKPTDVNKLITSLNISAKKIYNSGEIVNIINDHLTYNYLDKSLLYDNSVINLTKKESKLFELLLLHKNKIVKIEDIKKHIWIDKEVSDSALKTMFSRLTKKIGKDVITNSFGVGYGIYEK